MHPISKIASFLTSLWGVLTAVAVLFPGAAAVLKLPLAVHNSKLALLYPTFGSIIAAFALLFLTVYRDKLAVLGFARAVSLCAVAVALIGLFSYVGIRTYALDVEYTKTTIDQSRNVVITEGKSRGLIMTQEKQYSGIAPPPVEFAQERGDPWDMGCLVAFIVMFSALTVAFGSLGIHAYHTHSRDF